MRLLMVRYSSNSIGTHMGLSPCTAEGALLEMRKVHIYATPSGCSSLHPFEVYGGSSLRGTLLAFREKCGVGVDKTLAYRSFVWLHSRMAGSTVPH